MRKKVDSRVRVLVENGVKTRNRSMIMIVGDKGRDQIVNLHYMLSKSSAKARPSVLWCYNNRDTLGFTTHERKRQRQLQKSAKMKGQEDIELDPFSLFLSCTEIRFCYYKDSHKILGTTFGCLVLQDFESLTPNLLARTVETVEGGGLVIFLMKTMSSLKQLYTLTMDVHSRFRTESHQNVVPRFNERFLLSLGSCKQFLAVDDELNILPISSSIRNIKAAVPPETSNTELKAVQESVKDTPPIGSLLSKAVTADQAKAVLSFLEAISEKTLRNTVALTAARGRGKSAALGIALAGAIAYGYSNVFVTAPSPDNLKTLFDFVLSSFDALELREHIDYEAVQSTNPEFNHCIVRINVFRDHRQTIQYIHPKDHRALAQAELLVIDEAAAIPLPVVRQLLGPYIVFLSSTVNGYEGTGRSLSLKLVKQLRRQTVSDDAVAGRSLKEITLEEPIRYALHDGIEKWLNDLLCLDCVGDDFRILKGTPHPSQCELYHVNRDTLFSFHKASESFLHRIMALFVSSHYKNSPNDLQLLSDAPAHRLFVLLGPIEDDESVPDVLGVAQVCLEGEISKSMTQENLSRGNRQSGDLIPWTISQQFQDFGFASLSGARIVRIAVHPDVQRMGYGSRIMELLSKYYQGMLSSIDESVVPMESVSESVIESGDSILTETIAPKKSLPPLLEPLSERPCEHLDYIGTSFGITDELFGFWRRNGFKPVYIRQTANELTGEHTCIMLMPFERTEKVQNAEWMDKFFIDFRKRFMVLMSYGFENFPCKMALSILDSKASPENPSDWDRLSEHLSEFDVKRLSSYARNMVDYHMILDLLPTVTMLVLTGKVPVSISNVQAAILVSLGLQRKSISQLESELGLMSNQILAAFNKTLRKVCAFIKEQQEAQVKAELPEVKAKQMQPLKKDMETQLDEQAQQVMEGLVSKQRDFLDSMNLEHFAVEGGDQEWKEAVRSHVDPSNVSLKSKKRRKEKKEKKHKKQRK